MSPSMLSMLLDPRFDAAAIALAGATLYAWRWGVLAYCARIGDRLAREAVAFERRTGDDAPRVLVIGDSLAVGTGARRPEESIAGLIASEFPHATVVNRARNGARTVDALRQLHAERDRRYDLVLISVGGNDLLKRTPWHLLPPQVDALVALARRIADHVIVTTTPNLGLVPVFFAPLSWWLTWRSRQLRDLFAAAAERHGAHYVNFFHSRATDPFYREWRRFYAPDRLHPSTDCYALVYAKLREATPLARALTR